MQSAYLNDELSDMPLSEEARNQTTTARPTRSLIIPQKQTSRNIERGSLLFYCDHSSFQINLATYL